MRTRGSSRLARSCSTTWLPLRPNSTRASSGSPDQLREQALQRLREAIDLVERKADPGEAAEYNRFVMTLAETVAHAHREGGVFGIGGKGVSEREQAALDEIAATVGGASG
jgi:hypothetical protein